jgi:N-dimethylarginine dimethylaminohydrolase
VPILAATAYADPSIAGRGYAEPTRLGTPSDGYPAPVTMTQRRFGAQSMTGELRDVLVARPGRAFAAAFDDRAHGFLRPVDVPRAQREHAQFVETLARLGAAVHVLDEPAGNDDPDLVYVFDPLLVSDRGAIPLRPGKPNRRGEPAVLEAWTTEAGIPAIGRIEPPGTVEGGDTFWLRNDLLCIGRTLRTNDAGARQLAAIVGGDVRVFDVPYWQGPAELVHLLSVVSPVADDVAVVFLPLLPVGLWQLMRDLGIRLVEVPEEEYATLGCNVLAVRPGVVIVADGNPVTRRGLEAAGCDVHAVQLGEIGENGSGGPTCLTRPILRA